MSTLNDFFMNFSVFRPRLRKVSLGLVNDSSSLHSLLWFMQWQWLLISTDVLGRIIWAQWRTENSGRPVIISAPGKIHIHPTAVIMIVFAQQSYYSSQTSRREHFWVPTNCSLCTAYGLKLCTTFLSMYFTTTEITWYHQQETKRMTTGMEHTMSCHTKKCDNISLTVFTDGPLADDGDSMF